MLVIRKEDNNALNENVQKNKDEEHAYNLMLYVLKNFSDMSLDDQLTIFNKMSFVRMLKHSFLQLKEKVLKDYGKTINQESVTITDLKADYHISNGMLEKHLDSMEQVDEHLEYYQNLFQKEKNNYKPNIDNLVKISLVVERLINRRSVLNTGTPIIMFVKLLDKKQKLEIQKIKEQYEQQILIYKKEYEDKKSLLDQKEKEQKALPVANDKSVSNTDIEETDNVTNPNIDELEHHAKLKDSGNRTIRSNTNRSNSKQDSESSRVQSDTSDSSTAGTTTEDRRSEVFGGTEERRSKEAVF